MLPAAVLSAAESLAAPLTDASAMLTNAWAQPAEGLTGIFSSVGSTLTSANATVDRVMGPLVELGRRMGTQADDLCRHVSAVWNQTGLPTVALPAEAMAKTFDPTQFSHVSKMASPELLVVIGLGVGIMLPPFFLCCASIATRGKPTRHSRVCCCAATLLLLLLPLLVLVCTIGLLAAPVLGAVCEPGVVEALITSNMAPQGNVSLPPSELSLSLEV